MPEPDSRRRRALLLLFGIAIVVLVVDQLTKFIAIVTLQGRPPVPVIGDLAGFTFLRNPGAALGMGAGSTWVFALIAFAVFVFILVASRRLVSARWAVGLGLLLGGLTGNLIDRVFRSPGPFRGAVMDFIDLHFFVCNVADIAITAAACAIVLVSLQGIGLDGRTEQQRTIDQDKQDSTEVAQ